MARILAVDPGEKRLGIAISDPSGMIATPLAILEHKSRLIDAAVIASLAEEHQAVKIIVGHALGDENQPTPQSRRAERLAQAIQRQTSVTVELWDESGSTQAARQAHILMGASRRKRLQRGHGHLDDLAATYILQTYLDSQAR